jgi:metallophosphoesterase superfamily enzyme
LHSSRIQGIAAGHYTNNSEVAKKQALALLFYRPYHPGILIRGLGKQSLRFPCFYFGEQYAILPAFGNFTGFSLIEPSSRENVFAIVENKIIQIQ